MSEPANASIWREATGASTHRRDAPAVVTIGNFDGVHRGHQYVLAQARREGDSRKLPVIAVTFDPHPLMVLAPDHAPARLSTLARRIEMLRQYGADEIYVLAFNADIAAWSPHEFIDKVLLEQLQSACVIVGKNFRFGHKAAGDIDSLTSYGATRGIDVCGLDLEGAFDHDAMPYSSSLVRRFIGGGDVPGAAEILGRFHEVAGIVERGDQRGRDLGFPTANMPVDESYAVPPDGVYAGWLECPDGRRLPNAISVGTNPTFNGIERRIESHAIDTPDLELYDHNVRVEFVDQLRPMQQFDSVDALVDQMHGDVDDARAVLLG